MKNRKAFSLVELFVVLAILVSLTTIGIIGFKSFKKKANIASDNTVIDALNKYASDYKEENGKVKNLSTLADYIYEEKGFDINKLKPITKNYKYEYDFANNFFMLIDEKNEFADYKGLKEDCFIFVDSQQQFNTIKTTKYNMFLQEGNFDEKVEVNCSLDVGKNDEFVTITYKNNVAARDVYFYTNGGTLNKYTYFTLENNEEFIGHHFAVNNGESYSVVELLDCYITNEFTTAYSITSAYNSNAIANTLLTVAPPDDFYNWISMSGLMQYDVEEFMNDVNKYGLYEYEVFEPYVTYDQFVKFNGAYLKIAVEKGLFTFDYVIELINLYSSFMPN